MVAPSSSNFVYTLQSLIVLFVTRTFFFVDRGEVTVSCGKERGNDEPLCHEACYHELAAPRVARYLGGERRGRDIRGIGERSLPSFLKAVSSGNCLSPSSFLLISRRP